MKQKLKAYKGITLVALIITIIVLLILAVVAISAVSGNGILNHAQNAKSSYLEAQTNEQTRLDEYSKYLDTESSKINGGGADGTTVKGSLNTVISTTDNTPLTDEYGNKIMLPAGFKILVDDTTNYTADNINVTKGIVVEDEEGNQFVWIPVREIKNTEKTKTINLERNTFGVGYITLATVNFENIKLSRVENNYKVTSRVPEVGSNYKEATKNETTANEHSKDIETFVSKANSNGGYYIGRYEARVENYDTSNISTSNSDSSTDWTGYVAESGKKLKLVSKANSQVWNYVTQLQASERCQNMYTNKPYESDLVNSYAWDTAIIFFQEFGDNSTYASKKSVNSSLANTGTSGTIYTGEKDVICNVYDMASNCYEWSTETYSSSSSPCTGRGGSYSSSGYFTSLRYGGSTSSAGAHYSFRPLLYM